MVLGEWTQIGEIALLQIQTGELTGQGSYDDSMLVPVDTLRLTSDGVLGLSDGAWIVDRHHRHHPAARHWRAEDTLSFGFTSHYDLMWDLFRPHPLGVAGPRVRRSPTPLSTCRAEARGLAQCYLRPTEPPFHAQ